MGWDDQMRNFKSIDQDHVPAEDEVDGMTR